MSISLEEYNENLKKLASMASERLTERVIMVGAISLLSNMQNRIFRDGLDSNGNRIGSYSTKPYYATKDQFVKKSAFKPIGKNGPPKKKQKKKPKTMYLKEGYQEFREIQGRQTNSVNFMLRGDLSKALTLQAKENEVIMGLNDATQSLKRKGLEEHFKNDINTIFSASTEEKDEYSREVINELRLVEREILIGITP